MYGVPQANAYGQYAFGAYGGFPNQAAGAAGAPVAGSAGMPQPSPGGAGSALGITQGVGQTGTDPNAAAVAGQGGQAQWPGADPSSYYSNYWGGMLYAPLPLRYTDKIIVALRLLWTAGRRSAGYWGCARAILK